MSDLNDDMYEAFKNNVAEIREAFDSGREEVLSKNALMKLAAAAHIAQLKRRIAELKAQPAPAVQLERFGLEWTGPKDFVPKPMADGYWTPWHIAQAAVDAYQPAPADEQPAVTELVEAVKALPVEEWVEAGGPPIGVGGDGEPIYPDATLIGYVMQCRGEWDRVQQAIAALQGEKD